MVNKLSKFIKFVTYDQSFFYSNAQLKDKERNTQIRSDDERSFVKKLFLKIYEKYQTVADNRYTSDLSKS